MRSSANSEPEILLMSMSTAVDIERGSINQKKKKERGWVLDASGDAFVDETSTGTSMVKCLRLMFGNRNAAHFRRYVNFPRRGKAFAGTGQNWSDNPVIRNRIKGISLVRSSAINPDGGLAGMRHHVLTVVPNPIRICYNEAVMRVYYTERFYCHGLFGRRRIRGRGPPEKPGRVAFAINSP